MTKKDFELIADVLNEIITSDKELYPSTSRKNQTRHNNMRDLMVNRFISRLMNENERFNVKKFQDRVNR